MATIARAFSDIYGVTRASRRTAFNALGNIDDVANNLPGLSFDPITRQPVGLLIEQGTTNGMTNPRLEGAVLGVLGSGGALPTGMSHSNLGGLTCEIVKITAMGGGNAIDIRYRGTATDSNTRLRFVGSGVQAASNAQVWAASVFCAAVAGVCPGHTLRLVTEGADESGAGYWPGALVRVVQSRELTEATPTSVRMEARGSLIAGEAYDYTIRYWLPQLERNNFATTPMMPAAGSIAASTRMADTVQVLDPANIAFNATNHTFLLKATVFGLPQTTSYAGLLRLDNGTANNAIHLRLSLNGFISVGTYIDGVATILQYGTSVGVTPGVEFSVALTFGPGVVRVSLAGAPALSVVLPNNGLPLGMNRIFLGSIGNSGNSNMLNGVVRIFHGLPRTMTEAELQALSASTL